MSDRMEILRASIIEVDVDVIVNAANKSLLGGACCFDNETMALTQRAVSDIGAA